MEGVNELGGISRNVTKCEWERNKYEQVLHDVFYTRLDMLQGLINVFSVMEFVFVLLKNYMAYIIGSFFSTDFGRRKRNINQSR